MDIVKKRIKARVEELKDSRDPGERGTLLGLKEALSIIEAVEKEAPREAWGDY